MVNSIVRTTTNEPKTKIRDYYIYLNPSYKVLDGRCKKKGGKMIKYKRFLKAILSTGEKLILKHLRFSSKDTCNINPLGLLTDGVVESLDIQEKAEGEDIIVKTLMEYREKPLQKIIDNNELKPGNCFKVTL